MKQFDIEIINKLGLHARATAKLVSTASKFSAHIDIIKDNKTVNAKSIMGVMMLAAAKGSTVRFEISGEDENDAALEIKTLINNRFGELE